MKIRKTDIPNLDTESEILAAVQIHRSEEKARFEDSVNEAYTQHIKIRDLSVHLQNGGEWKFIDKTLEEEKEDDKLEAEKLTEQEKKDRIILSKTDGNVRDILITELMNDAGFTPDKGALALIQEKRESKDMSQYWSDSSEKLLEIQTMILEAL